MECCPKCGGTNGFQRVYLVEFCQDTEWDGEPIAGEQTGSGSKGKIATCLDCGARFNAVKLLEKIKNYRKN